MTDSSQAMEAIVREARDRAGPTNTDENRWMRLLDALNAMQQEALNERARSLLIAAAIEALIAGGRSDAEVLASNEANAAESARRSAAADTQLTEIDGLLPEKALAALATLRRLLEEQRAAARQATAATLESIRERRRMLAVVFGEEPLRSPEWAVAVEYFARAFARSLN